MSEAILIDPLAILSFAALALLLAFGRSRKARSMPFAMLAFAAGNLLILSCQSAYAAAPASKPATTPDIELGDTAYKAKDFVKARALQASL